MEYQIKDVVRALNGDDNERKYYVYRLVDPRDLHTFYVGKGSGNRVFQHLSNVTALYDKDNDDISLKSKLIANITASGHQVIPIIHRRGLTEDEAFEVEAALIDAYPGLTNQQSGHGAERGVITMEDFQKYVQIDDYDEPSEDYIIIKTTNGAIDENGSLYEATRQAWKASLDNARPYKYVLSVVYGIVREVYEVSKWYRCQDSNRIAFEGEPTKHAELQGLKGKRIPEQYRQKGSSNPFLYKKKNA